MDTPVLTVVAVAALVVALVAAVLGWVAHRRHQLIQRRFTVLWGDGEADVATVLAGQARRLSAERTRIDTLQTEVAALKGDLAQTLQHVAVVRYDAFGDMGGQMSFSAAVIDDNGDGMVISSIHARGESRTYAKGIVGGGSDTTLTPEEQQALAAARDDSATIVRSRPDDSRTGDPTSRARVAEDVTLTDGSPDSAD